MPKNSTAHKGQTGCSLAFPRPPDGNQQDTPFAASRNRKNMFVRNAEIEGRWKGLWIGICWFQNLVSEQRTLPSARRDPKVFVCELRGHAPAWSAVQKPDLHEERLVNLFNRIWLFGEDRCKCIHTHRPALILFDNCQQQPPV